MTAPVLRDRIDGPYGGEVVARLVRAPHGGGPVRLGLVHGLGANDAVWDRMLALIPDGLGVWSFGFPWDSADGWRWAVRHQPREWLRRALRLADDDPPQILVAHSLGANVLLDLICAGEVPRPAGLVLISPFYRQTPEGFDWAQILHYLNDFPDLLRAGILARRTGPDAPDLVEAMVAKVLDRIGPYGWMRFFQLFTETPLLDLAGLDMPCLVLGGRRDTSSYPADCRSLAGALPRATVRILPDCGHFTMIDDPARVASLIDEFQRGVGGPGRPGAVPAVKGARI